MKKPNVILISIDTLRADHLSCYGYHKDTTPHIDKIAYDGTIFRRNYSTGVWTPPGHASMLTGLYVSEHGVYGDNRLNSSIPTIADTLKSHGYKTAGFVNNSQVGELVGFERGHDTFVEVWKGVKPNTFAERLFRGVARRIRTMAGYEDMGAKKTNRLFKNWLEKQREKDNPFYAFLHYIEPHNPLNPPRPFKKRFFNGFSGNVDKIRVSKIAYNPLICFVEDLRPNEEEINVLKSLYDGEIAYVDHMIGELISFLKGSGYYDDTLIIITSDHGDHFGEHGLWSHAASLYNEVLHVPLIIKYPGGMDHIREVEACTQLIDIFPTIMEITGVSQKERFKTSGTSLVFNGKRSGTFHDYVYAEWEGRIPHYIQDKLASSDATKDMHRITNKKWMIADRDYKYISVSDGSEELYNLNADKKEQNNLIRESRDTASALKAQLNVWKEKAAPEMIQERTEMDEETKKNLERLGYM